ncbi:DUF1073 domain-containing protein [Acetobacteraceae bacterium]|nr:DUF1073 domain-containing protein [Acetobacteraceae bacterium]
MSLPIFKKWFWVRTPEVEKVLEKIEKKSWLNGFNTELGKRVSGALVLKNHFKAYEPPPRVVPEGYCSGMATDSAIMAQDDNLTDWAWIEAGASRVESWLADGIGFLGYPYLAEMALRVEFRGPCEILAEEQVREWINITSVGSKKTIDDDEISSKIKEIEVEFKRLNVKQTIRQYILDGLLYGLGHIWIDIEGVPITIDGQNIPLILTPEANLKGKLKRLENIEAVWAVPNLYNSDSPYQENYYKPINWWVQGNLTHQSRLLTNVPFVVSDLFKPAFNFGGPSLTQFLRPYSHNFLRIRNSNANIVSNFSKLVLKTTMAAEMETGAAMQGIEGRATVLRNLSEGQDTIVCDKEAEDVTIVSAPLSGLDHLYAQAQEAQAGIAGIPLVKLFGITPTGLNASSDGEIRVFYDKIAAQQEKTLRPALEKILKLVQLHLWNEIDPRIDFEFNPLWQEDAGEKINRNKAQADIDALYITSGVVSAEEARERLKNDVDSPYHNVDLSAPPPEPPEMADSDLNSLMKHDEESND